MPNFEYVAMGAGNLPGFTVKVDGVKLANANVVMEDEFGDYAVYFPAFGRDQDGRRPQEVFMFFTDAKAEIEWLYDLMMEFRERDHNAAIVLDKVNGDPEKLIRHALTEILAIRHAAGMLMNQYGEDDARFDPLYAVKVTGENASDELTDLKRAMRNGEI